MKGVFILFEPVSIEKLAVLTEQLHSGSVVCPRTAKMLNANVVAGDPVYLHKLRQLLEAGVTISNKENPANATLSKEAIEWLSSGERGISSEAMFTNITGVDALGEWAPHTPSDPSDFMRCRKLLKKCPEINDQRNKMRHVNAQWAVLMDHWEDLCEILDAEAPDFRNGNGSAPKTYAAMKEIYKLVEK